MEKGIRFVDVGNPAKSGSDDSDSETGQSAGDSNSDADASSDGTSSNEDTAKDSDSEDEESERETYYTPRDKTIKKSNPSGLIYHKYFNSPIRGKFRSPSKKKPKISENRAPPVEPFKWKATAAYRKQTIDEVEPPSKLEKILDNWPRFKDAVGPTLIDWDYEYRNPQAANQLLSRWESFVPKFIQHAKHCNIADRSGIKLLEKIIQFSMNKCSRDYHIFKLFPTVLKPKRIGKRKLPTILDAQKDHLVHCYSANDIGPIIELSKKKRDLLQPTIIVVGANDTELAQFYVFKDNVFWKSCSFIRCIDLVVKSTTVLGLKFSPVNELVWAFLRTFFYQEEGVENSKSSSVFSLTKALQ
ncbi:hypothetical protein pipiens_019275 [Culex pipiens pipiens]|uniref:Uncharacterized protein n=2 Tax=Culex pipiens TaxID=7175 RepID=A0ABD1DZC8_CULPP